MRRALYLAFFLIGADGCSVTAREGVVGIYLEEQDAGFPGQGNDGGLLVDGTFGDGALPATLVIDMTLRDFKRYDKTDPTTNPDFHNLADSERGVVSDTLGTDGRPVYKTPTGTTPTFGAMYFDQWYRDVPGTNFTLQYPITFQLTPDGQYQYDSAATGTLDTSTGVLRRVFFPIDDGTPFATPFGNQGDPHNYGFTGELHTVFTYQGEMGSLRFRSDDDLYVFIDKTLVVNLGGIHGPANHQVDLSGLGLNVGQTYPLDLFYAERMGKTGDLLMTADVELQPVPK
jgi:fibro-slime domain-containing protein